MIFGIGHDSARDVFVGRERECRLLEQYLADLKEGQGRLVTVAGEAGIGKTRLLHELLGQARRGGAIVLAGRCVEGAAGGAYGPLRAALDGYIGEVSDATLRTQLGPGAGVIAQLVPGVRARLVDLTSPAPLQPDEERTRLMDAVSQFLVAIAARAPLVLAIDDLHWANDDTLALFRHIGRALGRHRLLLVGAYREHEVDDEGPLAQTLALLRRQVGTERIALTGLETPEVEALLQTLAQQRATAWSAGPVDPALSKAIGDETKGNPFFVRSLVLHLEEEGRLRVEEGRWCAPTPIETLGLPDGVRQLLGRRIYRLTDATQSFLTAAAVVGGMFRFDVVAAAAELDDERALAAVDEALQAQLVESAPPLDSYAFVHALVRQTLYEVLDPSRQVRLHRRIAEAMERVHGERAADHAAEIAAHYHESRMLPDADRGVVYALDASAQAAGRHAYTEVARYLSLALDLAIPGDPRRADAGARLAVAYATLSNERAALDTGREAAKHLAEQQSGEAAAAFVSELASILFEGGCHDAAFQLAGDGLRFAPAEGSLPWASLVALDAMRRQLDDPQFPGILLDIPERATLGPIFLRVMERRDRYDGYASAMYAQSLIAYSSRAELRALPLWRPLSIGDYRAELIPLRDDARSNEAFGRIGRAAALWANLARFQTALGAFTDAQEARDRSAALIGRLPNASHDAAVLITAIDEWRMATDDQWDDPIENGGPGFGSGTVFRWYQAAVLAAQARIHARTGRFDRALRRLRSVVPAIERAPCWAANYVKLVSDAAETLWLSERTEHLDAVEIAVRQKVIASDLRYPMMDGRLSLARLCALAGRWDEAGDWFVKARTVLDEQGARPLRAIADYDEALMYFRRGGAGDTQRARPLLGAALAQFDAIRMPGWIRRAEALLKELPVDRSVSTSAPPAHAVLRVEGDYWTIQYDDRTVRLRHSRGLTLLARLVRAPGREIAATELVAGADGRESPGAPPPAADKKRIDELREELADATRCNDPGRAEGLRAALDALTTELARAVGVGDGPRRAGSHAERARVNATRALAATLQKITALHPELGDHLRRTVRTGTFCSYAPDPRAPIEWDD